jgi:hypothetical protein
MGQAAERRDVVVDMAAYLRETIAHIDEVVAGWHAQRHDLAVRLAVMESATSAAVLEAAEEFESRAAENRPYESAEPAEKLLTEAHRRFGT